MNNILIDITQQGLDWLMNNISEYARPSTVTTIAKKQFLLKEIV